MRLTSLLAAAGLVLGTMAAAQDVPALKVETVATPVVTARGVSQGLAPNARGGWTWVGEFMNYKPTTDKVKTTIQLFTGEHYLAYADVQQRPEAEWVIADLDKGIVKVAKWPGFHSAIPPVLAENGRLFFSVDYAHIYYYEPAEDTVKPMARVQDDLNAVRFFYKFMLGPDGMIYGSAQATNGLTTLIRVNPDTLEYKQWDKLGIPGRRSGLTYGYSLAVDPPWAYVAVGQGNWELVAVNMETDEKKILTDLQGEAMRITVSQGADFCSVSVTGKGKFWLVDGAMTPFEQKPADTPINQKKYTRPEWKNSKPMDIAGPPQLDKDRPAEISGQGQGEIHWRAAGATGDWQRIPFSIQNAEAARIESFLPLPDGSILGNVEQYHGFFRYYPDTKKLDYYGKHGPSGVKYALNDGKVWFDGYPNVNLWVYDPALPWTSRAINPPNAKTNPQLIGYFGQGTTEAHHCRFLLAPGNGRIYICGRRERWSTGTGLGYYDIATSKKFGLGQANKEFDSAGFIALPKSNRLVLSGSSKMDGKLIVYDMDLNEVERVEIKAGLANTGALYSTDAEGQFLGVYADPATKKPVLYLYDLPAKKIVKSIELAGEPGLLFRRADGTHWIVVEGTLHELDPKTLALKPVCKLDRDFGHPVWNGQDVYGRIGGELVKFTPPVK